MLSIVTLTRDNFEELEATIASTRDVSVPFENVVVNGGRCARTAAWLDAHVANHVSEPDDGIADAFDKGLGRARGDAVLFLNSGDVLTDPRYVDEACAALAQDPQLDFVYANVDVRHYSGRIVTQRSGAALPQMPFCHPTLICRREVFARIGGFDRSLRLAMDLDFAFRLVGGGFRGRHVDRSVVLMDGTGLSSTRHFLAYREKARLVFRYRRFDRHALRYLVVYGVVIPCALLAKWLLPAGFRARLRGRMLD